MSADYFSGRMQCRNINILCGADKHRNDAGKYSGSRIWYYVWRSVLFRGDGRQRSGICEFVFADYMYSDYRNICGLFCT